VSAKARRKSRRMGLRDGFRRENGLTPRRKVRVKRDRVRHGLDQWYRDGQER